MSDTESSTPASTATCPLLRFPPEIRNRIWTLAVTVEIVAIRWDCPKPSGKHISPTTMALACTCRQIYREVTPIYYSKNVFRFAQSVEWDFPWRFAAAIGPANAENITAVVIPFRYREWAVTLFPFPNLRTLSCTGKDVINVHSNEQLSKIFKSDLAHWYQYVQYDQQD